MKYLFLPFKSIAIVMAISAITLNGCSNNPPDKDAAGSVDAKKTSNKEVVKTALTEAFINGDMTAFDKYWSDNYVQHNPMVGNGREAVKQFFDTMAGKIKYEMGLITEDGDFVMVHGRYTGFGPKPMIAVDIFKVTDGKLAEHWDVLQEEVPTESTANKNPMFSSNM